MDDLSDDMKLYYQWKEDPNKENFQKLYKSFGGLINTASHKASYGSTLPKSAFKLQAAQEFHTALGNYNPDFKTKLSSFLYKSVQEKLKRINYTYANIGRISERSGGDLGITHITELQNVMLLLKDKLKREPTAVEIADKMGVPVDKVSSLMQEIRKDISLNADLEDLIAFDDMAAEKATLAMHYYDMSPEEQLLFDYAIGAHGKTAITKKSGMPDYKEIAKKMGISEAQVGALRKKLVKRF